MPTKFDKNLSVDSTRSEHIRPYVAEMPSIVRDIYVCFYSFISLDLSAIWKFESGQIWQDLPDINSKKLLT